jgi:type II secretory pathway pseudopilin PulG
MTGAATKGARRQGGFTLIELLLAAFVTAVVLGAAVLFLNGALLRIGSMAESRERNVRSEQLSERMRADIDVAGLNLVRTSTEGAGTEPITFVNCCGYDTFTPGAITNVSGWGSIDTATRVLGDGPGFVTFSSPSPTSGGVGLQDSAGNTWGIVIDSTNPAFMWWYVYENGNSISTQFSNPGTPLATYQNGDAFDLEIAARQDGSRGIDYYITRGGTRRLIYQSALGSPVYPVTPATAVFNVGGVLNNVYLTGAPIRDATLTPNAVAPLPDSVDGRPALPVMLHTGASGTVDGFTLLRGDVTADPLRLTAYLDARMLRSSPSPQYVPVQVPARGTANAGDYYLLIDYPASRSLLLVCQSSSVSNGLLYLALRPVTSSSPAWGLFFSDDSDLNYVFTPGTQLVKLDAPVEYRWDGQDTLFRRSGDQAWSVVATGVSQFNVQEATATDAYTLHVTARMLSDNGYTASDRTQAAPSFFDTIFKPRALNSTYRR